MCKVFNLEKQVKVERSVQNIINSRPNGVMLNELEEKLHLSRLLLGYITRKLQEEGKIVKMDGKYYPIHIETRMPFFIS